MVAGSYDRREITTRRVRYELETPTDPKTLGVVVSNVHRELGERVGVEHAYRVLAEEDRVVFEFDVEFEGGPMLVAGDEVVVRMLGGDRPGRVVAATDGELEIRAADE